MTGQGNGSIAVTREGHGPEIVLLHGGASPMATFGALAPLADRFTLTFAYRRGYPPSPPPHGHQDFEVDAADLKLLLDGRPHVVAHSYGGPAALIATARRPDRVRSLTLLETPIDLPDDPVVAHLRRLAEETLEHGLATDPVVLREFLGAAGARGLDDGPLPPAVARGVRRAQGARSPFEARPDLAAVRRAQIPTLVASGGHLVAIEHMCDALADALDAQRIVAPGAGHFVAAAPGFAEQLERFVGTAAGA